MKIVVAGGSGFIGTNFIDLFSRTRIDAEIINIDRNPAKKQFPNCKTVEDSISQIYVREYIKDADVVINFAAFTHVDDSIENPFGFVENNTLGVMHLLEAVQDFKKPYIHISTDEVYGEIKEGQYAHEDYPLKPGNPYAVTKASVDMMIQSFVRTYGIQARIVRLCNNYGPHQTPDKFIPKCIEHIYDGKKIPVYAKGQQIRQWIFVEDSCKAIEAVMRFGEDGEIYNVGTPYEMTNLATARLITSIMCPKADKGNFISFVEDRLGHDFRYGVDYMKIQSLGWLHEHTFEEGLQKTIYWYKEHRAKNK
jgi:dTDP-glucose 4,6-dehydratase